MSKRFGRFTEREIKNRIKRRKPVWFWKWTKDAWHEYKQRNRGNTK